jgi:hypothetical protein
MKRRLGGAIVGSLVASAALAAALATSPAEATAAAQKPCWRAVVADWASGGVDRRHKLGCYRSALRNLPDDIRTYTTAEEDIRRALLDQIRSFRGGAGNGPQGPAAGAGAGADTAASAESPAATRSLQGSAGSSGGLPVSAAPTATTPPMRAIVAAGLALALVLVAGIGKYYARRRAPHAPS